MPGQWTGLARGWGGTVLMLAAAYLLVVAIVFLFQRKLLYLPTGDLRPPAAYGLNEMESVVLRTADGLDLTAWYAPAGDGRPTILYFHGNAGHIGYRVHKMRPLLAAGLGVLLVEYRGYGDNPGTPSESGLYADGRAAVEFLRAHGVRGRDVVLYGASLGAGVAVQMATEGHGAALVLESPFTSVPDVAAIHYVWLPVRWLTRDRFDSAGKIGAVDVPLLVIHGTEDPVVPIRLGRRLYERAGVESKRFVAVDGANHDNLYAHGAADVVIEFIRTHVSVQE